MIVIGRSEYGKLIVAGVAKLYFETGLPLSIVFDKLKDNNYQPSWKHLVAEMEGNGMKRERVMHLLNEHIFESYGKEYRDIVINKLNDL